MLSATKNPLPRIGVGALAVNNGRVLLVKRKNPPNQGMWAVPGGKVEWGEAMAQTARREIWEETGLAIETGEIIYTFERIVRDDQGEVIYHFVIVDFLAWPVDVTAQPRPGDDAEDAGWFTLAEAERLPIVSETLQLIRKILGKTGQNEGSGVRN